VGVVHSGVQWKSLRGSVAKHFYPGLKVPTAVPDIRFHAKKFFFDRPIVKKAIGKAAAKAMAETGGWIRKTAQRLQRYRKTTSKPGNPPHAHQPRPYMRRYLWFSFNPSNNSLIVGPVKLNAIYWNHHGEPITGPVPNVLEFGGKIRQMEVWKGYRRDRMGRFVKPGNQVASTQGEWKRADMRSKSRLAKRRTRMTVKTIRPRPYMGPVLSLAITNRIIPRVWQGSVRAA